MGKVTGADEAMKLLREGRDDELLDMLEKEKAKAKSEPTEVIQETGRPAVFVRRGKIVVPGKDGTCKLKNPPRRKRKGGTAKS